MMDNAGSPKIGSGDTPPVLLLKSADAARILAISERTLWKLKEEGSIPHVVLGHAVRYPYAALVAWLQKQTISG